MTLRRHLLAVALATAAFTLAFPVSTRAELVADFYQGKRITMVVSSAPGPAYDLFARMLAGHMGPHIPGKPNFLVRNMPGAGGMVAANYAYTRGARDGTLMFTLHIALPLQQVLGQKGVRFDASKLIGLGRLSAGNTVTGAWHTAGIGSYKDLFTKELVVGGGQATSNTAIFPTVPQNIFGMKIKVVTGYKSLSEEILLAMERGEMQGFGSEAWHAAELESGILTKKLFGRCSSGA